MNEIFNYNGQQVRTTMVDGEPYFVGKDVADILGYAKARNAIANHVDEDDALKWGVMDSLGREQETTIINESGLYSLILSSKLPQAKEFKRWVTSEVLPSIRKHGMWATEDLLNNPDFLLATVQKLKEEQEQRKALEVKVEKQKPLVNFANAVSTSEDSILIGDFAKLMSQNGVKIGQNRLFEWLRQKGFLISRKGESWNMPKQEYLDKGLFEVKESTVKASGGLVKLYRTTKITGKGQVYFSNLILNDETLWG